MNEIVGTWTGKEEFAQIVQAMEARPPREHRMRLNDLDHLSDTDSQVDEEEGMITPLGTQNPETPGSGAPLLPSNMRRMQIPPMASGRDATTPTPTPPMPGVLSTVVM